MLKSTSVLNFRTIVDIEPPKWRINPTDRILCVGSCFAQRIGERMAESRLKATVNPWGTLYNPASIAEALVAPTPTLPEGRELFNGLPLGGGREGGYLIITLGTTHVFMRDGKVVPNCQKLPSHIFTERDMTIDEIVDCLYTSITHLHDTITSPLVLPSEHIHQPVDHLHDTIIFPPLGEGQGGGCGGFEGQGGGFNVIFTVSPYRYAHWGHNSAEAAGRKGMHGNQLSKARLLLAVDRLTQLLPYSTYFPAYEIVLDELRDYRFFDADMLHPNQQAVDYIWERFQETMLSKRCQQFIKDMEPIRRAYAHRPQNPDSEEYRRFIEETKRKEQEIMNKYSPHPIPPRGEGATNP